MSQLELLREKLHQLIEDGNTEEILKVSQELDKLIVASMQKYINIKVKSA